MVSNNKMMNLAHKIKVLQGRVKQQRMITTKRIVMLKKLAKKTKMNNIRKRSHSSSLAMIIRSDPSLETLSLITTLLVSYTG